MKPRPALLILLALVACGATEPTRPATDATAAAQPPIPATWVTIQSGDIEVTAPPDLERLALDLPDVILLQAPFDGRVTPLQVSAHSSSALPDQPAPGESLRTWLDRGSWIPMEGEGGVTSVADVSEREVLLPTGRALEAAATVQPGTPEASRVVAYAIETADGFAVLQILGQPNVLEDRADELRLIPLLLRFGD